MHTYIHIFDASRMRCLRQRGSWPRRDWSKFSHHFHRWERKSRHKYNCEDFQLLGMDSGHNIRRPIKHARTEYSYLRLWTRPLHNNYMCSVPCCHTVLRTHCCRSVHLSYKLDRSLPGTCRRGHHRRSKGTHCCRQSPENKDSALERSFTPHLESEPANK